MPDEVTFFDQPGPFLTAAADLLAADPVQGSVVAAVSERIQRERLAGVDEPSSTPTWWAVMNDAAGTPVSLAMRTMPRAPHALFLMAMPEDAALRLAEILHERGEDVTGANGALPAARLFAERSAALSGRTTRIEFHSRLFELDEVIDPPVPAGRMRLPRDSELGQLAEWSDAFHLDVAAQGGRAAGPAPSTTTEEMRRRVEEQRLWVWADVDDRPVHATGHNLPAFGVARIGPVYTPAGFRGRGYAAATVARVSRKLREAGSRVCLYTDQANPISNALYQRIGYRPIVDEIAIVIE